MKDVLGIVITALGAATLGSPVGAQGPPDIQAMLKWQQAQAIRYDVVAEYAGAVPTLATPPNSPVGIAATQVTDRYEISFDWNPTSMGVVGKPTFKNFPSKSSQMPGGKCPAPRVSGSYEHVEVVDAKTGPPTSNSLELSIRRTYPAAVIDYPNEKGVCTSLNIPATTTMDTQGLLVPLGMYLAMPQAVPSNINVGKDGQTMTLKDAAWTYTYKLRIVK